MVLALVGAEPVREATGRIVDFDLIPIEQLGRPRIDVLCSLSGIFRDSFGNILDLLDQLFEKVATADESIDENYIKKHVQSLQFNGIERPTSRLFSNPPGEFGSMVNEQIGTGDWTDSKELGKTWESRNSFSYGRGGETGKTRPDLLRQLLNTTDRIIQEIDCVEYGLTDIQEYYANTGALKKAAENNRKGKAVSVSVVESFEKKVKPRELEETLRMEYRSKLLNPKWSEAMIKQGSAGAYEISGRMTAMIGWASTTDFKEKWVFDGAAERYSSFIFYI
jgi:magnesium chelatase subunit H